MTTKYVLSTGKTTTKLDEYIIDLFRLYINIYPGDIPGSSIGFNFILTDVKKENLKREVTTRISSLVSKLQNLFKSVEIVVENIVLVDESKVLVTVGVKGGLSDTVVVEI